MRANRAVLYRIVALIGLASFSGCSISPTSKRTAAFSTAAVATTQKTTQAYQLVEKSYHDSQVAALVDGFDQDGFHPERMQPFIFAEDMKVRTRVMEGLTKYAETLALISSTSRWEIVGPRSDSFRLFSQFSKANRKSGTHSVPLSLTSFQINARFC